MLDTMKQSGNKAQVQRNFWDTPAMSLMSYAVSYFEAKENAAGTAGSTPWTADPSHSLARLVPEKSHACQNKRLAPLIKRGAGVHRQIEGVWVFEALHGSESRSLRRRTMLERPHFRRGR